MKSESSTLNVFVYGTLKPGEANFLAYCDGKVVAQIPGYVQGDLYALPVGYPAMTERSEPYLAAHKVNGVLLIFSHANILTSLDRLEGYQLQRSAELNEYYRRLVVVYDANDQAIAKAWTYFMTPAKVRQYGGKRLHTGNWTGKQAREFC